MQLKYPARYSDSCGEATTSIFNDDRLLTMTVRGVTFQGDDFDSLEPVGSPAPEELTTFTLNHNHVCSCVLEAELPLSLITPSGTVQAWLKMHLKLGSPAPNGGIDEETLRLQLSLGDRVWVNAQDFGYFEEALLDLQNQLPEGWSLKACITCAYSDYSPYGNGLFGTLACFRDNKQAYSKVSNKGDLFRIWDTLTEFVQETDLCPEFEKRQPGAGYRG